jgi:hypothetical protein
MLGENRLSATKKIDEKQIASSISRRVLTSWAAQPIAACACCNDGYLASASDGPWTIARVIGAAHGCVRPTAPEITKFPHSSAR